MNWMRYGMCFATVLTAVPAGSAPEPGLQKKIIAWGLDTANVEKIQINIRKIEELPFDGLILHNLKAHKGGEEFAFEWHCFGQKRFEREDFAQTIQTLKNIDFQRFTDNFLRFNVTPGDVDWFEDFSAIFHNARMWAEVTRETGMKGWMFDVEDYQDRIFNYRKLKFAKEKTFEEYAQQARLRGREFMEAVQAGYPDIVLLLALAHSYVYANLEETRPPGGLTEEGYGLLPAFLNGIIEGAGPQVRIIDGNERAYGYLTAEDYFRGFHNIRQSALALVPPELRSKYRARMEAGMALYVNYVYALHERPGGYPAFYLTPEDRRDLFEHNVYYALQTTDEYVWCYYEDLGWWEEGYPQPTPDGAIEAIRSAQAKIRQGQPLGFDMTDRIAAARAQMEEILSGPWPSCIAAPYLLPPGTAPPEIDGALEDPLWNQAPLWEPFGPLKASRDEQAQVATRAQVAFDDTHLYIAFRCAEPEPDRLSIRGTEKDDDIWRGDVVELFLSSGEEAWPYIHLIVNPGNVQWDSQCLEGGEKDRAVEWNTTWRSGAQVGPTEWTVEIALPWAAAGGRPVPGSTRRANLCRQRPANEELTNWSPTFRSFLEPERFGVWEFPE